MEWHEIPAPAVQRLSLYLRGLHELAKDGVKKVSSRFLGKMLNITAAQVRKDLAYFGQFGHPGVGYRVEPLMGELRHILGTDQTRPVVVVGAGNLGRALLRHKEFRARGFKLVGAFDVAPNKIGRKFGQILVQHINEMPKVLHEHHVKLGVIATPPEAAQSAADALCAAGIKGILNFAPTTLQTPPNVAVRPVDLAAALEQLSFSVRARR